MPPFDRMLSAKARLPYSTPESSNPVTRIVSVPPRMTNPSFGPPDVCSRMIRGRLDDLTALMACSSRSTACLLRLDPTRSMMRDCARSPAMIDRLTSMMDIFFISM